MRTKRMARVLLLAVSLAGILAISAVPGRALAGAPGSPPTLPLQIEPSFGAAGTTVQVSGKLLLCSNVIISWSQGSTSGGSEYLGTAEVLNGAFASLVNIPSNARPGPGRIVVSGKNPWCSTSGEFYVCQFCVGPSEGLASEQTQR